MEETTQPEAVEPLPLLMRPIWLIVVVAAIVTVDGLTKANALQTGNVVLNPRPASGLVFVLIAWFAFRITRPSDQLSGLAFALLLGGAVGNVLWLRGVGVPDFIHIPPANGVVTNFLTSIRLYPRRGGTANIADLALFTGVIVGALDIPFAWVRSSQARARRAEEKRELELLARLHQFKAASSPAQPDDRASSNPYAADHGQPVVAQPGAAHPAG